MDGPWTFARIQKILTGKHELVAGKSRRPYVQDQIRRMVRFRKIENLTKVLSQASESSLEGSPLLLVGVPGNSGPFIFHVKGAQDPELVVVEESVLGEDKFRHGHELIVPENNMSELGKLYLKDRKRWFR